MYVGEDLSWFVCFGGISSFLFVMDMVVGE